MGARERIDHKGLWHFSIIKDVRETARRFWDDLGIGPWQFLTIEGPDSKGSFPTIISYYPYHKDDLIGAMLEHPMRYFAAQGCAQLLVDFRGLGNSGG